MSIEAVLNSNDLNIRDFVLPELVNKIDVPFDPYREMSPEQVNRLLEMSQNYVDEVESGKNVHRTYYSLCSLLPNLKVLRPDVYKQISFEKEKVLGELINVINKSKGVGTNKYNSFALSFLSQALTLFTREEVGVDLINKVVKENVEEPFYLTTNREWDLLAVAPYIKMISPHLFKDLVFPEKLNSFTSEGRKNEDLSGYGKIAELRILTDPNFNKVEFSEVEKRLMKSVMVRFSNYSFISDVENAAYKAIISAPELEFRDGYVMPIFNPKPKFDSEDISLPDRRKF